MRTGPPIADALPADWQPLLASVRNRDVADALRGVLRDPVGGLTAPIRPDGPSAIDVALEWTTAHLKLAERDEDAVAPDADAHAVRMLMQHALWITSRGLPTPDPGEARERVRRAGAG